MKQNWTYKKLGEVCEVSAGQGAPQGEKNYCSNGTPFVKAGNVEDLINGLDENCIQKVNEDVAKSHKLKLYKAGSVVFAKSGMSSMKGLVYTLKHDCYVVSHLAILTPKEIESSYLNHVLNHFKPNTLIKDEAYPSISLSDISQFTIPVPPLAEQQRIVSELDLLQGIMDKQQAQLKELDTLAQAVFYDMFGDPVENEKGWEVKRLGELSSLVTNGNTPKGGEQVYVKKGILFLRSQNVWRNRIEYDDIAYIDEKTNANMKKSSLHHNDILITKTGRINTENSSLGRAAIFTGETGTANINGHVYLIRLLDGISHVFVIRILTSRAYRDYIRKVCVGGIDKRQINKEQVDDFPIILPPLPLQQSFAAKIESIEKQKAAISKSIAETEKLFEYTMDKYFG